MTSSEFEHLINKIVPEKVDNKLLLAMLKLANSPEAHSYAKKLSRG